MYSARIVDAQEYHTARRVCQRNQLRGHIFSIGRDYAARPKTYLLELGVAIFPSAKLIYNLFSAVEHRSISQR